MKVTQEEVKRVKPKSKKIKRQNGITLIALVVTIVVLLILAGITINMLFSNGGIFKTAQDAANAWNEAVTNEQASLENLADQIANLVNGTEDTEIPDILERYILGEDKTGISVADIINPDTMQFIDNDIIPDASTSVIFISVEEATDKFHLIFEYDNEIYIGIGSISTSMTEELIKKATETTGKWDGTTNDKVTAVQSKDATPVNVPVPKGFTASTTAGENTVEGGFVIKQDGTNNEFVWIPVSVGRLMAMYTEETVALSGGTGVTTSIYGKISIYPMSKPGEAGCREPDLVVGNGTRYDADLDYQKIVGANSTQEFAQDMVNEYQEIHDSIEKYGGFYIGRYELTGEIESPTVAKGGTVIGNQNWYNLKAACMKLVNNEGKQESEITAKTTMIYGNQWAEVCNWLSPKYDISNSSSWGNYSNYNDSVEADKQVEGAGEKQKSGASENWKANNIYDFAGNCTEWTQMAVDTTYRIMCGGAFNQSGSDFPALSIFFFPYTDNNENSNLSTRPTLYIM